ncbi:MAG: hypothetical protein IPM37_07030 [Hahellaceae bacterium]|nr:hypothetical protein [Hahellaceae bacterium]
MSGPFTLSLQVDNLIPRGDPEETRAIIELWTSAQAHLQNKPFEVQDPGSGKSLSFTLSLKADAALGLMNAVRSQFGSFNAARRERATHADMTLGAVLAVELAAAPDDTSLLGTYHAASVFFQQLYLALNLALPGACQLLATRFIGEQAHRFESQNFDASAFYDARASALEQTWPPLSTLDFVSVWAWLERTGNCESNTAVTPINKVLIDLLKVGQQQNAQSARTALLVANQIELLLGTHRDEDLRTARQRASLIFGPPPEAADGFKVLFQLRQALFKGAHPVRRPALVYHSPEDETVGLLKPHNSGVERSFAVILALLQQLIKENAQAYRFSESLTIDSFNAGEV